MGGCTAFDVVMILERMREKVTGIDIALEAERASEDPKVFTHVKLIYKVTGQNLKRANVERAVNMSAEKYCSASIMIGKSATIEHVIEIIDEDERRQRLMRPFESKCFGKRAPAQKYIVVSASSRE